ncbi:MULTISPECIES: reverse transcriptase family protein [Pseudoalteromonas]|uniref:reverse transcriptase family protein n=1 Tax=Pseudoalteromonas TaxID=53246 RepID=UPI00384C304F
MNKKLENLFESLDISDTTHNLTVVSSILFSAEDYYREFNIPKRKGGFRKITSPYPTLHLLQERCKSKFFDALKVHTKAYAFESGRNAIEHAKLHCGSKELLTIDINDFFLNIKRDKVFNIFYQLGLDSNLVNQLSYLCTLDGSLPQGACTSPKLSNAVFYHLDCRLDKLAQSFALKYSRYADDLAFSGDKIPKRLIKIVVEILSEYNFRLNEDKTKFKVEGSKKIITGISISSGEVKVPKKFKRELRAQVYELERNRDCLYEMPNFDPLIYEKTLGKINYLLQVEPNNEYAKSKREIILNNYKELLRG